MNIEKYMVKPGETVKLKKLDTVPPEHADKSEVVENLFPENLLKLKFSQEKLYAHQRYGLVIVLQAMDAAGKDSMIKKVFSNVNPQGVKVHSFKQPSDEESRHDYLWRIQKRVPRRGEIAIFNRSHYEDVIVTRVHDLPEQGWMPKELVQDGLWKKRFRQINDWECYLVENGYRVVKFFLNISKERQNERLLERIKLPEKHWKFTYSDITERRYWEKYQDAYEDMLKHTSTEYAPWYIIPADKKWFARYLVSEVVEQVLEELQPDYPEQDPSTQADLERWARLIGDRTDVMIDDLTWDE